MRAGTSGFKQMTTNCLEIKSARSQVRCMRSTHQSYSHLTSMLITNSKRNHKLTGECRIQWIYGASVEQIFQSKANIPLKIRRWKLERRSSCRRLVKIVTVASLLRRVIQVINNVIFSDLCCFAHVSDIYVFALEQHGKLNKFSPVANLCSLKFRFSACRQAMSHGCHGPQHLIITLSDKSFNIFVCRAYIQLADAMLWCGYTRYLGTHTANLPITHAHVQ